MFAAQPSVSKVPNSKTLAAPVKTPVVLVVDDDPAVRDSLGDLLASVGIEAMLFGSTQELLDAGLPDRPACLVLDLRLPGTSGLELQSRLSEMGVHVPIIFITGHGDVPTSVRAMKAGAVDFLPKPFRQQELLDAVIKALREDKDRRSKDEDLIELRRLAERLTARERDVLRGVGRGLLNKQIAHELGVSEITVKMHRSSARRKLKATSAADIVNKIAVLRL
ncbi:DNA-binding response regulator [Rhodopseudomonas palustris]|uniref:DNA-binding response regulator n=1 Tax=Rhodopseudomonas palustris TaxID=1076 RepID=A0A418V1M3_RHOPL|nr:DNA-binding response regulator [Rhodopseudomonas palustris]